MLEHVVFIIGAGHSISAGAPSTHDLTDWIVDRSGRIDRSEWSDAEKKVLIQVLDHLATPPNPRPTYEAIFTWLWSSHFSDDPTMYRVAWDADDPFAAIGLPPRSETKDVAYRVLRRIEEGVFDALRDSQPSWITSCAQRLIVEALEDTLVKKLALITTNHDRVLEVC